MPLQIKLADFSIPQAWILNDATPFNDGIMTSAQAATVLAAAQMVAAGGAEALLDLESAVAQMPTPFGDEIQTRDDTPVDVALLSVTDNPSTMLSITVDITAYDEALDQFFDTQLRASYKPGAALGEFTQYNASVELYKETSGAPAWTAVLTQAGGSTLPVVRLTGAAATVVIWKIYAAIRSAP